MGVGLMLLAIALALEGGVAKALAAGALTGLAGVMRTEVLLYAGFAGVALLLVGGEWQAWVRRPARIVALIAGLGAVLIHGAKAPRVITREQLRLLKRNAVLVDVSIDQGGCFETSRPTTHSEPTYEVDGIIHYCVANMPGAVPLTSSQALNNATLPFGLAIANQGFAAVTQNPHLRAGLNVHRGRITNKAVAESLGLSCPPIEDPIAA